MPERVFVKDGLRVSTSVPKAATQLRAEGWTEQLPEPEPAPVIEPPPVPVPVAADEAKPNRRRN